MSSKPLVLPASRSLCALELLSGLTPVGQHGLRLSSTWVRAERSSNEGRKRLRFAVQITNAVLGSPFAGRLTQWIMPTYAAFRGTPYATCLYRPSHFFQHQKGSCKV